MKRKRTIPLDGERITRLRMGKGWSVTEFAKNAGCSIGTISNAEKGASVYLHTIKLLAKCLGVEPNDIAMPEHLPLKVPKPKQFKVQFDITITPLFEDFDQTIDLTALVDEFIKRLGGDADMNPIRIEPGSTVITFEATLGDLMKFMRLYVDGAFDDLNIVKINVPDIASRSFGQNTRRLRTTTLYNGLCLEVEQKNRQLTDEDRKSKKNA